MEFVKYEEVDRCATITLNRPEKRNALNEQVVKELSESFQRAEQSPEVKVVILGAEGKAFCAGADLAYLQQLQNNTFEENLADSTNLMKLYKQIYLLPKVVIAAVQGHAIAGGCGLVTVCDYAIASEGAKFGYTETKIGFIPAIVMSFLIRKIGEAEARYLLLKGDLISAREAREAGLIYKTAGMTEVSSIAKDLAMRFCAENSAQALSATKRMITEVQEMNLDDALMFSAQENANARSTEDCQKGIAAFLAKRDLNW